MTALSCKEIDPKAAWVCCLIVHNSSAYANNLKKLRISVSIVVPNVMIDGTSTNIIEYNFNYELTRLFTAIEWRRNIFLDPLSVTKHNLD